ncbi:MAG: Ig-like domain-containing protein [Candidatus Dormibacteria bacterium]
MSKGPSGPAQSGFNAPSTVKGLVAFTPPDGSSELDPARTEVVVRPISDGATLKSATVQAANGDPVSGELQGGEFHFKNGLRTDTRYTVTAVASAKGQAERTETSLFSTATTPKVVSTKPMSIGEGQSVVVALAPAAGAITLDGPVKGQLSPDGTQVTVVPDTYHVGQTYRFGLVARNRNGVAGSPQSLAFSTLPAATVDFSPNPGTPNLGVAIPLTITLSGDATDRNDLVSRLAVTATVNTPAAAPGSGVCATYAGPQVASGPLAFNANWLSANRVRLTPKTPDGYWPANSAIALSAKLTGYHTADGSAYIHDASTSFVTGDKRVVDVDLAGQNLTACKNGTQANQFLISSGTANEHASFDGTFYIYRRVADEEMKSPEGPFAPAYYDIKHVPWTQYFDGGAALHGAWWHNNFGHPMSHGCINLQTPADNTRWPNATPQAEYLWNFDNVGDPVIVHGVTPGLTAAQQKSD